MDNGFEILEPEATLYQAARFWDQAAAEWGAAAAWLDRAVIGGADLGFAYHPHAEDFARAYSGSLYAIRDKLVAGAEALHDAAHELRNSADAYVRVDSDLDRQVDHLVNEWVVR